METISSLHRASKKVADDGPLSVLIIAANASFRMGGEASLPLHYFLHLRRRGVRAWLSVHERNAEELRSIDPDLMDFVILEPDTLRHRLLWRIGRMLPSRLSVFSTGFLSRLLTQRAQSTLLRPLFARERIDVVHLPTPVSPKEPAIDISFGRPMVIGPMNGGIDFPSAFRRNQHQIERYMLAIGRVVARMLNGAIPGKRRATLLLAANPRTQKSLEEIGCPDTQLLPENGVDLSVFQREVSHDGRSASCCRFVFAGRLVDWKAVDLLLEAYARVRCQAHVSLTIVGDGPERRRLLARSQELGLNSEESGPDGSVTFCGWLSHEDCAKELSESDVLVLPSLMECGGAVVLEAMAMSLPVIATNWGGPADYLDDTCGILVPPDSREGFINGLTEAMLKLAASPELRRNLGQAGRRRVVEHFDWEAKIDRMLSLYRLAIERHRERNCCGSPAAANEKTQ